MNILVTGGAGFIGSHVCKTLAKRGFAPVVYDNLSRGHRHAVKWGPLEIGSLADSTRLHEVIAKHKPAAVMHFAAFINVGESVEKPQLYHENNVVGSAALLKAICDTQPIPFVFSSTAAVYGLPEQTPIPEDHPLRPINPYGANKLEVEKLLTQTGTSHGLPWVALRYFNAAGSDPDGEIGEEHDPETHLIPLVIKAALRGTPIGIFGTDYNTPDGTCIRDYVHVLDIADAHVRALEHLLAKKPSGVFNLANARGYSVRDVIAAAERICGRPIAMKITQRRLGDPAVLVGSSARAQKTLGWKPERSSLDTQIKDAWAWFQSRA